MEGDEARAGEREDEASAALPDAVSAATGPFFANYIQSAI